MRDASPQHHYSSQNDSARSVNNRRNSISGNTVYTLIEKAVISVSGLLIIPFIIKKLGYEQYGLWVLLYAISEYFGLALFCIPFSFRKHIAEFRARDDILSLKAYISTSFYVLIGISFIICSIGILLSRIITTVWADGFDPNETYHLFIFITIVFSLSIVGQIFLAIPQAFQRFDLSAVASIAGRTVYLVIILLGLSKGLGIYSVVWGTGASAVMQAAVSACASRGIFPQLTLSPRLLNRSMIRDMFHFGARVQITAILYLMTQNIDKIILGKFVGVAFVAIYDMGARLVNVLRDLPQLYYGIIFTHASDIYAKGEQSRLLDLYLLGTKFTCIFFFGCVALLYPWAEVILTLWLGEKLNPLSIGTFKILLVGTVFLLLTGTGTSIVRAMGKPEQEAKGNAILAVLNLSLVLFLISSFGYSGAAWGTTISYILGGFLLLSIVNREVGTKQTGFFISLLSLPILLNSLLMAGGNLLLAFIGKRFSPFHEHYWIYGISFLSNALLVGLLSMIIYLKTGYISSLPLVGKYLPRKFRPTAT